jgi:hypothetical protein
LSYEVRIIPSAEKEMNRLLRSLYARLVKESFLWKTIPVPEVSVNSAGGRNIACGWAITASYTLLTIEIILSPLWQSDTGVKFMVSE